MSFFKSVFLYYLTIWDIQKKELKATLLPHHFRQSSRSILFSDISFSKDGSQIASLVDLHPLEFDKNSISDWIKKERYLAIGSVWPLPLQEMNSSNKVLKLRFDPEGRYDQFVIDKDGYKTNVRAIDTNVGLLKWLDKRIKELGFKFDEEQCTKYFPLGSIERPSECFEYDKNSRPNRKIAN